VKRRDFVGVLVAAAAWPLAAWAQQVAMPIVGFVAGRSTEASARPAAAFRKGLNESGYIEGQNVVVEYHWLEDQYDRLPAVIADFVRRRVAVIATPFSADDDPYCIRGRRRPGEVRSGHEPCSAGRQCDRHQFFPR
jgi:hypothetical protein